MSVSGAVGPMWVVAGIVDGLRGDGGVAALLDDGGDVFEQLVVLHTPILHPHEREK